MNGKDYLSNNKHINDAKLQNMKMNLL